LKNCLKKQGEQSKHTSLSNSLSRPTIPNGFPAPPVDWTLEEDYLDFGKNKKTFVRRFISPVTDPSVYRIMVIIHGFGEHSGRYFHVPYYLKNAIDRIDCFDLQGHGQSSGIKGDIESFDTYVRETEHVIRAAFDAVRDRQKRVEIHLLGHSMGGHIALRTAFLNPDLPLSSVIVSAPFLRLSPDVSSIKQFFAKVLIHLLPGLRLSTGLNASFLSHDSNVVKLYQQDASVHGLMTPRFFVSMTRAMADTTGFSRKFPFPLKMLVPLADKIVDPNGALDLFKTIVCEDKELETYPDFYHEIMNEKEKERVFKDIENWLNRKGI